MTSDYGIRAEVEDEIGDARRRVSISVSGGDPAWAADMAWRLCQEMRLVSTTAQAETDSTDSGLFHGRYATGT